MSVTLLWPHTRWPDDHEIERQAAGKEVDCTFARNPLEVTDEQWARGTA